MLTRLTRARVALVICLFVAGACAEDPARDTPSGGGAGEELIVQSASFDLAAGEEERFIAGVLTPDQLFVSYGTVQMKFFYLGTEEGSGTAQPGPEALGRFLAIEGDAGRDGPVAAPASEGRGVYEADVLFEKAGYWAVELTAELDGKPSSGRSVFEVREEHTVPAVGEAALRTENRTLTSDVPKAAIDSRARATGKVPDPELHEMTIAESISRREPALVVFSTPVYCQSRFCGPVTDMVSELQKRYADRANFIHVEIWFDFQKQAINEAAADWLFRRGDLTEPWIFLIDEKGKIVERWDNVAVKEDIEPLLRKLPRR